MKTLRPQPPAAALATPLLPQQPVLRLQCPTGRHVVVEVLAGRLWLTHSGHPEDHFLDAGQRLQVHGPATLYASAEGPRPAQLRWVLRPVGHTRPRWARA